MSESGKRSQESHPTDEGGERSLNEEATTIRRTVDAKRPRIEARSGKVSIKSPDLIKPPGFCINKSFRYEDNYIKYVPDFKLALENAQAFFYLIKDDRAVSRNDAFTIHNFTLYNAYAMVYALLRAVNRFESNVQIRDMIEDFNNVGFQDVFILPCLKPWFDAMGKFSDGQGFSYIPILSIDDDYNSLSNDGILHPLTAALIPNFRAMLTLCEYWTSDKAAYIGRDPSLAIDTLTEVSRPSCVHDFENAVGLSAMRIRNMNPLMSHMYTRTLGMSRVDQSSLRRYLMYDPHLLNYLSLMMAKVSKYVDFRTIQPDGSAAYGLCLLNVEAISSRQERSATIETQNHGRNGVSKYFEVPSEKPVIYRMTSQKFLENGIISDALIAPVMRIHDRSHNIRWYCKTTGEHPQVEETYAESTYQYDQHMTHTRVFESDTFTYEAYRIAFGLN